ncbi:MAG: hypothetical protein M3198_09475 [Actinomycetota bacterium]|nr:hypothetical protein [Actinomycetota bacterium]
MSKTADSKGLQQPEREPERQTTTAPAAPERTIERADARRAFLYCLKIFLVLRVGLTILALATVGLGFRNDTTNVPGWPAPKPVVGLDNVGSSFERWDALWFLRIAEEGYSEDDGSAAFFPLYPMTVRALSSAIGGHPLAAAIIISNAAFLAALMVVYLLSLLEHDETVAKRTVLYMSVWPTAFFFLAPYSESLFLLLAAGSVLCARRGKWLAAAALGALAAATRSIGVMLAVVLAIEALSQWRERQDRDAWSLLRPVAISGLVGVGTLAYLAYWKAFDGDWFAPVGEQANWQRVFSFPLVTIRNGTEAAFAFIGANGGGYALLDWVVVVVALIAAGWVALRARPAYGFYAWASLLLPLAFIFEARPFMSVPRFTVVIWPLFWALARFGQRYNAHAAIVACSAVGLGLFTTLFVNWYWIF